MKKIILLACLVAAVFVTAGTAMAESIRGRAGITGRIGILGPADNDVNENYVNPYHNNRTDIGFVGGGGLIYGIDDHFAAELEVTRTSFGSDSGDFGVTNVSLGAQYRFALQQRRLVPYVGGGLDILVSDYDPNDGIRRDVDTTVGGHVNGGVDYFIQKNLALTAEAKLVVAPDTSITDRFGNHRGDFDPSSFSTTAGIRFFFN